MATVTPLPPLKPLHDIALNKAEIEAALQVITPLQPSSSLICENSSALECFSSGFTSNDGDVFVLLLERRSSHDEAFNFWDCKTGSIGNREPC